MRKNCPRIMIAGTGSGCGKTTVTCAVLSALKQMQKDVTAYKCGPDYIDPMFHSEVLGTRSRNLDLFLCGENTLKYLLCRNAGADISVIEGVMGMYDGMGFADDRYSATHIARLTETPQLLVVNVRGKSLSLAAEISGYLRFGENRLAGVILNDCTKGMYPVYRELLAEKLPELQVLGYLPHEAEAEVGSRHLGLITAGEIEDIQSRMALLGKIACETLDMEAILRLAAGAPAIDYEDIPIPRVAEEPVRIGIARDRAFCFYYQDALDLLTEMGAELVPFSPVHDRSLPENLSGLILGGGYPELYLEKLEANETMRSAVREAINVGMPTYAECGGFMFLGETIAEDDNKFDMVNAVPGHSFLTKKLVRFGYKELTAQRSGLLCEAGEKIRCHEFHYSDTDVYGDAFLAANSRGKVWETAHHTESLYAGYPHIHFWSNPSFAENLVKACAAFRERAL